MRKIWPFIYLVGAVLCVIGGYGSLAPAQTAGTNADWIFITITLVTTSLFPLGAMAFSRLRGVETFRRPSLVRHPLGWWSDTLQPLRVTLASMSCYLVARVLHFRNGSQRRHVIFVLRFRRWHIYRRADCLSSLCKAGRLTSPEPADWRCRCCAVHVASGFIARRFGCACGIFTFGEFGLLHIGGLCKEVSPNKSPEPTAVGAVRSAIAVHVTSRRWLSFFR